MNTNFVPSWLSDSEKENMEQIISNDISSGNVEPVTTGESLLQGDPNAEYIDTKSHSFTEEDKIRTDAMVRQAGEYSGGNVEQTLDTIRQTESVEAYNSSVDYAKEMGYTSDEKLAEYYNNSENEEKSVLIGEEAQDASQRMMRKRPENSESTDGLDEGQKTDFEFLEQGAQAEEMQDETLPSAEEIQRENIKTGVSSVFNTLSGGISSLASNTAAVVGDVKSTFENALNNAIVKEDTKTSTVSLGTTLSTNEAYDPTVGKIANIEYKSYEVEDYISDLNSLYNNIDGIPRSISVASEEIKTNITPETLRELGDVAYLFQKIKEKVRLLGQNIDSEIIAAKRLKEGAEGIDYEGGGTDGTTPTIPTIPSGGGGHHHSGSGDHSSVEDPQPVEEVKVINQELIAASVGSLVFETAINIYETIGGEAIQTGANVQYGLVGIEKVNDIIYYKMIDKTTGKVYYVKATDITKEVEGIENDVLHTKDKTMILSSTDIGTENNFVKLADGDMYYIITEKQEINGINYATILDSNDGKTYYIPMGDSVETIPLNNLSVVETPEVIESTPEEGTK